MNKAFNVQPGIHEINAKRKKNPHFAPGRRTALNTKPSGYWGSLNFTLERKWKSFAIDHNKSSISSYFLKQEFQRSKINLRLNTEILRPWWFKCCHFLLNLPRLLRSVIFNTCPNVFSSLKNGSYYSNERGDGVYTAQNYEAIIMCYQTALSTTGNRTTSVKLVIKTIRKKKKKKRVIWDGLS